MTPVKACRGRRHRAAPTSSALDAAQKNSPQLAAGLKSAPRRPILIYALRSARIFHRWRYARSPEHLSIDFKIAQRWRGGARAPQKHAARHPRHHRSTRDNSHPRRRPLGRSSRDRSDADANNKGWAFVPNTSFMEKKLVPEDCDFPASSNKKGKDMLRQDSVHFQLHHVYETTDAHGNTVYYAHEGSL